MVRSVARALEVLQLVARSARPLSLHAICGATQMPKSTAFTILKTLVEAGFLEMRDERTYAVAEGLLQFARDAQKPQAPDIRTVAREHLQALAKATGESVLLGLPEGDEVIYVEKIDGPSAIRYIADIGTHRPLHCTASGKLCLSMRDAGAINDYLKRASLKAFTRTTITDPDRMREELARIRSRGYSVSNCEYLEDVLTVAAAIVHPQTGQLLAVVAVSGPAFRMRRERGVAAKACQQAAARIAEAFAHPPAIPVPGSSRNPNPNPNPNRKLNP